MLNYITDISLLNYKLNPEESIIDDAHESVVSNALSEKIDKTLNEMAKLLEGKTDNSLLDPLKVVVSKQKEIVRSMRSDNPELDIAQMFENAINSYAQQLDEFYGWIAGGVEMFRSSLMFMFDDILKDGIQSTELEDIFQLALLEIMINGDAYGLGDFYDKNKTDFSHMLESIGSASHALLESGYNTPEKIANVVVKLFNGIKKEGNIPEGSFLDDVINAIDNQGGQDALYQQITEHWYDDDGYWVTTPESGVWHDSDDGRTHYYGSPEQQATNFSPTLRLSLLAALGKEITLTQEVVNLVLGGTIDEVDKFIEENVTIENEYYYDSATLAWLDENTSFSLFSAFNRENAIDWSGDGISMNTLMDIFVNFPGRELTEDEMEEVNRIGDQVKIILNALKSWNKIWTDERLSIAQNI